MSCQINTLELAYFAIDENVPFLAIVFMRDFISSHAFQTAWPYKCYLVEVVVGEAFGNLSVLVPEISSELKGPLNEVNRNLYMLVCNPSPISTPSCVTRTLPSVYNWNTAPSFWWIHVEIVCQTICIPSRHVANVHENPVLTTRN